MIRLEDLEEVTKLYNQMIKVQEDNKNQVLINPEIKDGDHPLERHDVASTTQFNLGDYSSSFTDKTDLSKILLYSVNNNTVFKLIQAVFDDCKEEFEKGKYTPEVAFEKLLKVVDTSLNLYIDQAQEDISLSYNQRALIAKQLLFHFTKDLKKTFNIAVDLGDSTPDYPTSMAQ